MAILLSKPAVIAAAATLNQSLAEVDSVSNEFSLKTKGAGSTLKVYIGKPAKTWAGKDEVPENYKQDQEKVVDVVLENISAIKTLGLVERANDLIDEQQQISGPMLVGMQRTVKKTFFNGMAATCNTYILAEGQTWGGQTTNKISWGDLSKAIARVKDSLVGDGNDISILLPSFAQASLLGASLTNFLHPKAQDDIFNNRLASFEGADLITTNVGGSRPVVSLPAALSASAAEGDNAISVPATTVPIPAGTLFTIAGVYALDMEGNEVLGEDGNPEPAVFGTPIDLPAGVTAIPLGKTILTDSEAGELAWGNNYFSNNGLNGLANGGNPGVGGGAQFISSLPKSGAAITQINGGKNMVFVYSKLAFAAAFASPAKMAVHEEYTETRYGVPIRTSIDGSTRSGKTDYRMDIICGFSGVYCPGAVAVLF